MAAPRRREPGILAGQLLIAGGALTLINMVLPDVGYLDVPVLYATGGAAILLGLVSLLVPWRRLHPRAALILVAPAFALISISNAYGAVTSYNYVVFFAVVFVWVGITQPPGTALLLAVPATAAYTAPAAALPHDRGVLLGSTTVAIPVCVLIGEVLSHATRRNQRMTDALQQRVATVERLAALAGEVGRSLDPVAIGQTVTDAAAELFDGKAVFASVGPDDEARVLAIRGLDPSYLDHHRPVAVTSIGAAARSPGRVAVVGAEGTTLPVPAGGCVMTVACFSEGRVLGGLTVLLDRPVEHVDEEARDVLRLLGAQAEVTLLNAARHARLVEQRQHEEAIVDVLVDGVIVLDPDGNVRSCNDAAAALLGWDADSLVGKPLPFGVSPGESIESEIEPGTWIETSAASLPGTGETVIALRDVSRQHALDAAKDLFLATTSHELRTPLTAIKGYVATLLRHWNAFDDAERRRSLRIIDSQTDALIRLTDHLLLGARAVATPRPQRVYDLRELVAATAAAHAEISPRHQIVVDAPNRLPKAVGDPDAVRSVLSQLIENAVKYSPDGGEVRITVAEEPERLVVDVLDRGVGLPAGGTARLFEPFSQGAAPNTRSFSGVGLGLYIVRRLVEGQGGSVSALPRPGGGSDFRFTLPLAPLPSPRRSRSAKSPI